MAADPTHPASSLLDLPHETLALTASWLTSYDIIYGLAPTCRVLYAVANDPVTWARAHIRVESGDELKWVLNRYGQHTTNVFGRPGAEIDVVADLCPNLSVYDSHHSEDNMSVSAVPGGVPLTHLRVHSAPGFLPSIAETLRAFSMPGSEPPVPIDDLVLCKGLTYLRTANYFETPPGSFPHLVGLFTTLSTPDVSPERWSAFVAESTLLRDLELHLRVTDDSFDDSPVPSGLSSLSFYGNGEAPHALVRAFLRANRSLIRFSCDLEVDAVDIQELSQVTTLTSILRLRTELRSVNSEQLQCLETLKLQEVMGYRCKALITAMFGNVTFLSPGLQTFDVLHVLGPRLRNLRSLLLDEDIELTVKFATFLATHCKRLKKLVLMDVDTSDRALTALLPALSDIVYLSVFSPCVNVAKGLAAVVCNMAVIEHLRIDVRTTQEMDTIMNAALDTWGSRRLDQLILAKVSEQLLCRLHAAGESELLRVRRGGLDTEAVQPPSREVARALSLCDPGAVVVNVW